MSNGLSKAVEFHVEHVFFLLSPRYLNLLRTQRNMNQKGVLIKLCFLTQLSLVRSVPFPSESGLQHPKHIDSEVCVYNDVIYPAGQNFTSTNPCETCICDPPRYTCTVKNCLLRVGCKALHMANECCPEYVCDCEKNGKRYANGEKVDEANPCKVCYCTGGEIKCNLVECYSRSDCEPIYVPGRCCPKYDHCPPLEQMRNTKPTTKAPSEVAEKIRDDVSNGSQHSSASVKPATVATLEIIEIHPTNASVFQKPEGVSLAESELEVNVTATLSDVTSSFDYEYANGTEETGNERETTVDVESSTLRLWKESEGSTGAEPET